MGSVDLSTIPTPIALTKKKLGNYVELVYDAKLRFMDIDWYRVYRGFGGRDDREDWVADIPGVAASISRWKSYKGSGGGWEAFGSEPGYDREAAMSRQLFRADNSLTYELERVLRKLQAIQEGRSRLAYALLGEESP